MTQLRGGFYSKAFWFGAFWIDKGIDLNRDSRFELCC